MKTKLLQDLEQHLMAATNCLKEIRASMDDNGMDDNADDNNGDIGGGDSTTDEGDVGSTSLKMKLSKYK